MVVFLIVYQLVAISGIWAKPGQDRHGLGRLHRLVDHARRGARVRRLLLVGTPVHDVAQGTGGRGDRCGRRCAAGLAMGSVTWLRRLLEPWLTFRGRCRRLAYFFPCW